MSFTKKTWTDRISEYPTRRTLTKEDGTTETVTVTREEGTISQEGDAYSAANMNDLEQRVADGFSTLSQDSVKIATKNTTSDSIAFGIDPNGNYGYIKEGADTVTPFKSQKDIDNAYNSGVAAADARVNISSASYNKGVSDADNRVNTSSASYNSGYANGYDSGMQVRTGLLVILNGNSGTASDTLAPGTYYWSVNSKVEYWIAYKVVADGAVFADVAEYKGEAETHTGGTFTINHKFNAMVYGHAYGPGVLCVSIYKA